MNHYYEIIQLISDYHYKFRKTNNRFKLAEELIRNYENIVTKKYK